MYELLRKVPLFAGLSDTDLTHLCQAVEEVRLSSTEELFAEGNPGDRAYVVKEGQVEILKASSGRDVLLAVYEPGAIIGEMALLEGTLRTASARARTDAVLLAIGKDQFDQLLSISPSAAAIIRDITARKRAEEALQESETMLRQSEKMAVLGTLTAGVAHELNNPAAAVKSGAAQLEGAIAQFGQEQAQLSWLALTDAQQSELQRLTQEVLQRAARPPEMNALARSDREGELEAWLEGRGVPDAWKLAPTLVNLNYDAAGLTAVAESFAPEQLPAVIGGLDATYAVYNVMTEIGQSAGRISEIVKALKSYSYVGLSPVQAMDVHEGLDNTLLVLGHKLKSGISVRQEYAQHLPNIQANGSELNQVLTNMIPSQKPVLRKFQRFSTSERYRMLG